MLSDIKAIVFDLDGTLYINRELGRAINQSACRYIASLRGIDAEAAAAMIKATKRMLASVNGIAAPLSLACMELGGDIRELHRHFAEEIAPEPYLSIDSRVVDLLRGLRTRYDLYVYTNNNSFLSERIMRSIGVTGLFQRVITIEDTWRPKPDLRIVDKIINDIGRKPVECLFVGDRYDIDLRYPADLGAAIFMVTSIEDLLNLNTITIEENI